MSHRLIGEAARLDAEEGAERRRDRGRVTILRAG
jgi:hypothetical protein